MIDKQEIAAFRRLLRLSYTVLLIFAMLLPKLRYATLRYISRKANFSLS